MKKKFAMNNLMVSPVIKIDKIQEIICSILNKYDGVSCYLFGSYAKKLANEKSDIDILLLFDKYTYEHKNIKIVQKKLHNIFKLNSKYCEPIYGYVDNINSDLNILYRQYINYGILIYGNDIKILMNTETHEELKQLEYSHYWKPLYMKKNEYLEVMVENNMEVHSLMWQYLFLVSYWYAKAELTLVSKQNSLNNYRLKYIYQKLLYINLSLEEEEVLDYLQKQRDSFEKFEDIDDNSISFIESFDIIKNIIGYK